MCTVTYVPTTRGFIFTSNRDEQSSRKTLEPQLYNEGGLNLFYPKDQVAGGTWIGVGENKRLVCLLNGGFVYHDPAIKFSKSRGIVVKSMLMSENLEETLENIDLNGVAPFTLIVVDWKVTSNIYELVWCKEEKSVTKLNFQEPYIWSSSTLYTDEMKIKRKKWFAEDVVSQPEFTKCKVLAFHQNENLGDKEIAPKMKREMVETISTTMVKKIGDVISMDYHDYVSDNLLVCKNIFEIIKIKAK